MPTTRTTNFTVRLDTRVKADAEKLFNDLGMTLSGAFNIFLHQALLVQGLPFAVRREQPNPETLAAMKEAVALAGDPDAKTYASAAELMVSTSRRGAAPAVSEGADNTSAAKVF